MIDSPVRNPAWTRDELILALAFYLEHEPRIPNKKSQVIGELSREINAVARRIGHDGSRTLRNVNGVYMKLMNFRSHDPAFTARGRKGLTRGNKDEAVVWDQFVSDRERLNEAVDAIRSWLSEDRALDGDEAEMDEPEVAEAEEGRLVTRLHRGRERNRNLVKRKKAAFFKRHGRLFCEACGFDFQATYGDRGVGFIECHHVKPVHTLRAGSRTKLPDLVLLCANCHRMVHSRTPWLSLDQLRSMIRK